MVPIALELMLPLMLLSNPMPASTLNRESVEAAAWAMAGVADASERKRINPATRNFQFIIGHRLLGPGAGPTGIGQGQGQRVFGRKREVFGAKPQPVVRDVTAGWEWSVRLRRQRRSGDSRAIAGGRRCVQRRSV